MALSIMSAVMLSGMSSMSGRRDGLEIVSASAPKLVVWQESVRASFRMCRARLYDTNRCMC